MGAYSAAVLADNPRVYYKFNESSGNAFDSSGNSLTATWSGGTPTYGVTGPVAGDTAVTVSTSHTVTPDDPLLDVGDVFSLEIWVKRSATQGTFQGLIGKGTNSFLLWFFTDNKIYLDKLGVANLCSTSSALTDTASWHHVVGTKNGSSRTLYVDGVDVTTLITDATVLDTNDPFETGYRPVFFEPFVGSMAQVALYATQLSAARVLAHYEAAPVIHEATSIRTDRIRSRRTSW